MKFQPLNDLVLISPIEKNKTRGGIIIPSNAEENLVIGRIAAMGDGILLENGTYHKPSINVNDIVVYSYYAAQTLIDYEDRKWHLIRMFDLRSKIMED